MLYETGDGKSLYLIKNPGVQMIIDNFFIIKFVYHFILFYNRGCQSRISKIPVFLRARTRFPVNPCNCDPNSSGPKTFFAGTTVFYLSN